VTGQVPQRWALSPEDAERVSAALAQANAAVENFLKAYAEAVVPAMLTAAERLNEYAAAMRAATPQIVNILPPGTDRAMAKTLNRVAARQGRTSP